MQKQTEFGGVKTRCFKIDWLVPIPGIVVLAGCLWAATTYRGFEQQVDADETLTPTLDRLTFDLTLSLALKQLHDGEVEKAAQRLDLLLCWDILRADTELASADDRTRAWIEDTLRRIARTRPKTTEPAVVPSVPNPGGTQEEAQRVLVRVLKTDPHSR